jgi:hypothetical protein
VRGPPDRFDGKEPVISVLSHEGLNSLRPGFLRCSGGHLVPRSAVEITPSCLGRSAAVLLEEEAHSGGDTAVAKFSNPFDVERAMGIARLAADDDLAHSRQVEVG